mmetsp:Transcript_31128/g.70784  ORF Transcript_31128/g.70784 Transcript_31128/m.70784 type:complete len:221 (+) Transcript_31128:414-1076(+)
MRQVEHRDAGRGYHGTAPAQHELRARTRHAEGGLGEEALAETVGRSEGGHQHGELAGPIVELLPEQVKNDDVEHREGCGHEQPDRQQQDAARTAQDRQRQHASRRKTAMPADGTLRARELREQKQQRDCHGKEARNNASYTLPCVNDHADATAKNAKPRGHAEDPLYTNTLGHRLVLGEVGKDCLGDLVLLCKQVDREGKNPHEGHSVCPCKVCHGTDRT